MSVYVLDNKICEKRKREKESNIEKVVATEFKGSTKVRECADEANIDKRRTLKITYRWEYPYDWH